MSETATYAHGHHESVLRSHFRRTAENSAGYLLKYLQPTMHILDVGCGPGTITTSLARLVPDGHVTGVDFATQADMLDQARHRAAQQGLTNVDFAHGDICHLKDVPDDTYDVVHCHQVLQHVADPIQALREMRRVAKPGGLVAAREADSNAFAWYPESATMDEWRTLFQQVARATGTEPNAGRRLVAWALAAGFERAAIDATAGTWCYSTPDERAWFGDAWADRTVHSTFARRVLDHGLADSAKLKRIATEWREWAAKEDGWFAMLHGEVVCRV